MIQEQRGSSYGDIESIVHESVNVAFAVWKTSKVREISQ